MSFHSELNNVLRGTNYSLKQISWNDVSRYTSHKGGLSSVGSNITDVKLVGKNDQQFYTIRTDNWNEKVGTVNARDVAIVTETDQGLIPITLNKYLFDQGLSSSLDDKVSIRFQTTFLPITADDYGSIEFCTDSYSYNTPDSSNPKNLLLLATTQGLTLHTNKSSHQKLFLHSKDSSGKLVNRWLEAEETTYKVGAEQIETDEQVQENMKRGKASSGVIGIKSMGQRFNALLTVQIPLKQKERTRRMAYYGGSNDLFGGGCDCDYEEEKDMPVHAYTQSKGFPGATNFFESKTTEYSRSSTQAPPSGMSVQAFGVNNVLSSSRGGATRGGGAVSSAARVSKGTVASEYATEVDTTRIKRSETEHITITVILYHVVKGGIPTREDVISAVTELDQLYSSCTWSGNLKDLSNHNVIPSLVPSIKKEELAFINRTTFPV